MFLAVFLIKCILKLLVFKQPVARDGDGGRDGGGDGLDGRRDDLRGREPLRCIVFGRISTAVRVRCRADARDRPQFHAGVAGAALRAGGTSAAAPPTRAAKVSFMICLPVAVKLHGRAIKRQRSANASDESAVDSLEVAMAARTCARECEMARGAHAIVIRCCFSQDRPPAL